MRYINKKAVFLILAVVPSIFLFFPNNLYCDGSIINGGFKDRLDSWIFEDASVMHNCPTPKAHAYVKDGWAVIHGHSCTANGILKQNFTTITNPDYFSIDYKLEGYCSAFNVRLNYGSDEVILFRGNIDTTPGYPSTTSIIVYGKTIWKVDTFVSSGTFKILFDYTENNAKAYLNSKLICSFTIPTGFKINSVNLKGHNNCYDGRNDVYVYFDNIILTKEEKEDGPFVEDLDNETEKRPSDNKFPELSGTPKITALASANPLQLLLPDTDDYWKPLVNLVNSVLKNSLFGIQTEVLIEASFTQPELIKDVMMKISSDDVNLWPNIFLMDKGTKEGKYQYRFVVCDPSFGFKYIIPYLNKDKLGTTFTELPDVDRKIFLEKIIVTDKSDIEHIFKVNKPIPTIFEPPYVGDSM